MTRGAVKATTLQYPDGRFDIRRLVVDANPIGNRPMGGGYERRECAGPDISTKLKMFAFLASAFTAGIGGAFYVHYLGSIALVRYSISTFFHHIGGRSDWRRWIHYRPGVRCILSGLPLGMVAALAAWRGAIFHIRGYCPGGLHVPAKRDGGNFGIPLQPFLARQS
ncbi:MAG: hypothetical protein CM1200mP18_13510 [Gammaproteobacteria bacterium]|nr:MAG: hypothetical protein CM1200mP18_13510 [Gammaproteobacteria bacterium]